MDEFLQSRLKLRFHPNKKHINLVKKGFDFTGFIIKPGRTYLRQTAVFSCKQKIRAWERRGSPVDKKSLEELSDSVNSYLGMLRQVNGYNARKTVCERVENLFLQSDADCTKINPAS